MALHLVRIIAIFLALIVWMIFMNIESLKCIGYCDESGEFIIQKR